MRTCWNVQKLTFLTNCVLYVNVSDCMDQWFPSIWSNAASFVVCPNVVPLFLTFVTQVHSKQVLCSASSVGSQRNAARACCWAPAPAACSRLSIDRYLLTPPAAVAAVDRLDRRTDDRQTDGRTDGRTPNRYLDACRILCKQRQYHGFAISIATALTFGPSCSLDNDWNHHSRFTAIIDKSTCVSQHLQLRTGGYCWCKVLLTACPCWRQPAHLD